MKLKYILLSFIFILAACTDEAIVNKPDIDSNIPEGTSVVNFKINGLGGKTKSSYADTYLLDAIEAEKRIDSVMIYIFRKEGNDIYDLENIGIGKVEMPNITDTIVKLNVINEGLKHFVLVANGVDTASIQEGISYADFCKQCAPTLTDSLPKASFYMVGEAAQTLTAKEVTDVNITLTRLVSRVDISIRNTKEAAEGSVTRFELEKARIVNSNDRSYLVYHNTEGTVVTSPEAEPFKPEWKNVSSIVGNRADLTMDSLWHCLYAYETLYDVDEQVYLEIAGQYNGVYSEYKIPLTVADKDTAQIGDQPRHLLRNHRYLVYIDSVTQTDVIGDILVGDWDFEADLDTVDYIAQVNMGVPEIVTLPTAEYLYHTADTRDPAATSGYFKIDTLDIQSSEEVELEFVIDSKNLNSVSSSTATWLLGDKGVVVPVSYADTMKSDTVKIRQRFTVKLEKFVSSGNGERERRAEITFRNPIMKGNKLTYVIRQYLNPLKKFTNANLSGVETFGTAVTTDALAANSNSNGCWFQWGRNLAFENNITTVAPNTILSSFEDGNNGANTNFIGGVSVWHSEAGHLDDTWYKLANSTYMNSDPCPEGYRLPDVNEWLEVIPYSSAAGTYTTAATTATVSTEFETEGNQIATEGPTLTGPSKYIAIAPTGVGTADGVKIVYGVKRMGTRHAYALRWTYKGAGAALSALSYANGSYLKIECAPVKFDKAKGFNPGSVGDFTNGTNVDWSQAEVRFFPAAGDRYYQDGKSYARGYVGHYWSSSASSTTNGWSLNFYNGAMYLNSNPRAYGFSVRCVAQ